MEQKEVTEQEVTKLLQDLEGVDVGGESIFNQVSALLGMDDAQFAIISPGIIQAFQKQLNNPADKILLAQMFNASGEKADELLLNYQEFCDQVDKINISNQKRDFLKTLIGTILNSINDTEGIAKRIVPVGVELCNENAKMPQYAHLSDSGMDVYAVEDTVIHPGETVLVPTGIKMAIPVGYEIQVRPKSGRALKTKLRIANTPGTIDQGYKDEIKVIVDNIEPPIKDIKFKEDGTLESILYGSDFTISKGEKFCQLVLNEVPKASLYIAESVETLGENRNGGFGSTSIYSKDDPRYKTDINDKN